MARVHPQPRRLQAQSSPPSSSPPSALQRAVFTIWMKSLVLNGNGCAVYDSAGSLSYRVDNYDRRRGEDVYLMDPTGDVVFRILRRKTLGRLERWEGHRYYPSKQEEPVPSFTVKKPFNTFGDTPAYEVLGAGGFCYRIEGFVSKSAYKITDEKGELVLAEVKRKQTASGMALGNDVLTLAVEPNSDVSLVVALVVVCGLINNSM